ncbi:hypothetical protein AK812_SmicGene14092 [Symbiodinium microadriaticum]|uniref:Uncharacterized protein n=1 Tax=Symbiodinium microadriaticum TaxID=2951 RepID=A0A1Q9E6C0_SYMMI|nr:hypothetical protein AK812_SmicGene14092 [Symbiodinium microadriaticum]
MEIGGKSVVTTVDAMTARMQDAVAYTQSPATEGSLPENLVDILRAIKDLFAMQELRAGGDAARRRGPRASRREFVQLGLWAFSELGGGGELEERGLDAAGTQGKRTTVGAANAGVPSPQHEMPWAPSVRAEVEEAAILGERKATGSQQLGSPLLAAAWHA